MSIPLSSKRPSEDAFPTAASPPPLKETKSSTETKVQEVANQIVTHTPTSYAPTPVTAYSFSLSAPPLTSFDQEEEHPVPPSQSISISDDPIPSETPPALATLSDTQTTLSFDAGLPTPDSPPLSPSFLANDLLPNPSSATDSTSSSLDLFFSLPPAANANTDSPSSSSSKPIASSSDSLFPKPVGRPLPSSRSSKPIASSSPSPFSKPAGPSRFILSYSGPLKSEASSSSSSTPAPFPVSVAPPRPLPSSSKSAASSSSSSSAPPQRWNDPQAWIAFLLDEGECDTGKTLEEIRFLEDEDLENEHNYIQRIFPTFTPSEADRTAPVLCKEVQEAFLAKDKRGKELRKNLILSFELMLGFYGFEPSMGDGPIIKSPGFDLTQQWLSSKNQHNFARISRILESLSQLGCAKEARQFLEALQGLYTKGHPHYHPPCDTQGHKEYIPPMTRRIWANAVSPPTQ